MDTSTRITGELRAANAEIARLRGVLDHLKAAHAELQQVCRDMARERPLPALLTSRRVTDPACEAAYADLVARLRRPSSQADGFAHSAIEVEGGRE